MKKIPVKIVEKKSTSENKVSSPATRGIHPLGSRVLIRPFTKEELTKKNSFGIILPTTGSKEKSEQGTIIAVGPGDFDDGERVPMSVKVGDIVAFSKYGYEDIHVGGEELFLIKEENILAILK